VGFHGRCVGASDAGPGAERALARLAGKRDESGLPQQVCGREKPAGRLGHRMDLVDRPQSASHSERHARCSGWARRTRAWGGQACAGSCWRGEERGDIRCSAVTDEAASR